MDYTRCVPDRFRLYVFDLDGTLVDSLEDLFLSVNRILSVKGYSSVDRETVRRGIGNGAKNLLLRSFAASASSSGRQPLAVDAVDGILREYRAYYDMHCTEHTALYPGMREWLEVLRDRGCVLAVLTNKPEQATRTLLQSLQVDGFFAVIAGPESFDALKPNPAGLYGIMRQTGCSPEETVMIGDSIVDIGTARNAGVVSCGITGGLGDDSALRESRPDILIQRKEL